MPLGLVVVRALHFWSVAILLGGGGFLRLIGGGRAPGSIALLRAAALVAAVTGAAWFVFTFVNVTGGTDGLLQRDVWSAFIASPFGPPWVVELALDVACLALSAGAREPIGFIIVGTALAVDQAWLGHAATETGALGVALVASYVAHVFAGFAWVGALTMLCLTLRSSVLVRDGLAVFSTLGLLVVATILASGCLNAAFHMSGISDLWTTPYGRLVLVKATLFAAMLALALFNRREGRHDLIDRRGIAIGVGLETFLGLLVLCAAAALGITAPSN